MGERWSTRRLLVVVAALALTLVLATVVRGPVALAATGTAAALVGLVLAIPPLLRDDGIDWDWQPRQAADVPPEPGIAALRLLLDPARQDPSDPARLQAMVRAIAEDRARGPLGSLGAALPPDLPDALGRYLSSPPHPLDLVEVERVITDLEALETLDPSPPEPLRPRSPS